MTTYGKRTGDDGKSTLSSQLKISKSDARFEAIGAIEELSAAICLYRATSDRETADQANEILSVLDKIVESFSLPQSQRFVLSQSDISLLEKDSLSKIEKTSGYKPINEQSAKINVAAKAARKAERRLVEANLKFAVCENAVKYLNRLSDYLAVKAKQADQKGAARKEVEKTRYSSGEAKDIDLEKIVAEVVKRATDTNGLSLEKARELVKKVEEEAARRGMKAVVCVCDANGAPITVDVMDGAYLISFEVALKKAYTAVALKTDTLSLNELTREGQTFYGLQNLDKIIVIGGGIPLTKNDKIVGGLGVSGGTGEEDHSLCLYGVQAFENV